MLLSKEVFSGTKNKLPLSRNSIGKKRSWMKNMIDPFSKKERVRVLGYLARKLRSQKIILPKLRGRPDLILI